MKKTKIYESIDSIKVSERDKERIYDAIINKNKEKNNVSVFRRVCTTIALIICIFALSIGTVYGMAKLFNWDSNLLSFFGIEEEDAKDAGIDTTEIEKAVTKDGMTITVKQIVSINKVWYTMMEIDYETPNMNLNSLDSETVFCDTVLTSDKSEEAVIGFVEVLNINEEKTKAMIVVTYDDYEVMKLIDNGSIVSFKYAIGNRNYTSEDEMIVGICPEYNVEIKWEVENFNDNNSKYEYDFDNIIVKETEELKIIADSVEVTPVDIKLSLRIYGLDNREFAYLSDDELIFDKTIDLVFNDGKVIELNGYYDDPLKLVQGSNRVGKENIEDDYYVMGLIYNNMLSRNSYSKLEFKLIDVDSLKEIRVGDLVIETK